MKFVCSVASWVNSSKLILSCMIQLIIDIFSFVGMVCCFGWVYWKIICDTITQIKPTGVLMNQPCHCKSNKPFSQCCEPFLRVLEVPSMAEQLMRSRYSAYCLGDVNYLQATTHDHTWADEELKLIQDWADNSTWQHLDVLQSSEDMVEFKAYYIFEGRQHMHHEKSSFLKVNDMWKYVDGEVYEDKVEFLRNEKCICGSGDKYKRCCFRKLA